MTRRRTSAAVPRRLQHCFWNVDMKALEVDRDADAILGRVLEYGVLKDVLWVIRTYGFDRIHTFFRTVSDPEIGRRTYQFWRAFFDAEGEPWPRPPKWRQRSSAPWIE